MLLNPQKLGQAHQLLGELLAARKTAHHDLVVCGGSALLGTMIVSRSTQDVDVLARKTPEGEVSRTHPLPEELLQAAGEVARELGLESGWLNSSASIPGLTHRDRLPELLTALGPGELTERFQR